ncbi:hypothetical protein P168DRAFT_35226 [Aspergillus campestris IBT 28561]|uniref:Uncharacterized protein n=1 Tax=Aspergillus campestris (strain IBT 28561) TaxID=1392248 RepID=A0A2I1DHN5_ASPC2|nr:uncharacterized protein P168DRAFT_35226 [Aspergillus campestris IBT 28561]PKY09383.1 hypothetical protein P168DRAFT_35226 [Aspergillus campestris IBT 28561]
MTMANTHCRRSQYDCDENTKDIEFDLDNESYQFFTNDVAVKTYICYKGKRNYLLNAINPDEDQNTHPWLLPGGDHTNLDGTKWGGVTVADIVESSVEGWLANGQKNGWARPDMQGIVTSLGETQYSIRTPGFFDIPVCEVQRDIVWNMVKEDGSAPFWPCGPPENYNKEGTDIVSTS